MTSTDHRRLVGALAVTLVLLVPFAGCSGDSGSDEAASTTTTAPDVLDACAEVMPGVAMSPEQATVRFSPEAICPAYVTVVVDTTVTWVNNDDTAHTLTIYDGAGTDGEVLFTQEIEPGTPLLQRYAEPTTMTFTLDVQDAFRGTIEVLPDP